MFNRNFIVGGDEIVSSEIEMRYKNLLLGTNADPTSLDIVPHSCVSSPITRIFMEQLEPWTSKFLEESEGRLMGLLDLMFPKVSHDDVGLPSKYDVNKFVGMIKEEVREGNDNPRKFTEDWTIAHLKDYIILTRM